MLSIYLISIYPALVNFLKKFVFPHVDPFLVRRGVNTMMWNTFLNHINRDASNIHKMNRLIKYLNVNDLIVKPSDKGGCTVIISKSYYVLGCLKLLEVKSDYLESNFTKFEHLCLSANHLVHKFGFFIRRLLKPRDFREMSKFRVGIFYGSPKVHKDALHPPFRPVVSQVNHPTAIFSKALTQLYNPFVFLEKGIRKIS
ncbi:MAG: hypothetical protein MHMPM18_000240 [Marteilia pararefringens]